MKPTKDEILRNVKNGRLRIKFTRDNSITPKECYDIVNSDKSNICPYCGENELPFISYYHGYKPNCRSCTNKRREETNLRKYGCKNISGNKEVKQKKIDTVMKNYGKTFSEIMLENAINEDGIHKSQTEEVKRKRNKTLMDKYGTTDPLSINNGRQRGLDKCNNDKDIKEKRIQTCRTRYSGDTSFSSSEVQDKVKQTMLEKYGCTNIMFSRDFVENEFAKACLERDIKRLNDIDENGLNAFQRASAKVNKKEANEKRRITNEANGNWITEDLVEDFKDYYKLVWRYTNQNDLSILENFELRGHANQGKYHLDHKYSIFQGYKDNISAKAIGSIYNLEMLIGRNNLSKGKKCSLTLNEIKEIECLNN